MAVFVADGDGDGDGDGDPMILPHFSDLLAGLIPQARVKTYSVAAYGFLFQHHADFAGDLDAFLREDAPGTGPACPLGVTLERQHQARANHSLERRSS